ncbi:MAG TPA: hypothetical protein VIJ16_00585 [Gemmatimonadaceae bacterium]
MAKPKNRRSGISSPATPNPFEEARDELFQHIIRCDVTGSAPDHQQEWFDDTMKYMADRYPELAEPDVEELKKLGLRFAQPPKAKPVAEEAGAANAA